MRLTSAIKALGIKIRIKGGSKVNKCPVVVIAHVLEILSIVEVEDGRTCLLQFDYIDRHVRLLYADIKFSYTNLL
jgi:hypothetical protein